MKQELRDQEATDSDAVFALNVFRNSESLPVQVRMMQEAHDQEATDSDAVSAPYSAEKVFRRRQPQAS